MKINIITTGVAKATASSESTTYSPFSDIPLYISHTVLIYHLHIPGQVFLFFFLALQFYKEDTWEGKTSLKKKNKWERGGI